MLMSALLTRTSVKYNVAYNIYFKDLKKKVRMPPNGN